MLHVWNTGLPKACTQLSRLYDKYHAGVETRDFHGNKVVYSYGLSGVKPIDWVIEELQKRYVDPSFPGPLYLETAVITRLYEGQQTLGLHADAVGRGNVPNRTPFRAVSAILYLTRCHGGELVFPHLAATVSPSESLFVAFPSDDWKYAHLVNPIKPGEPRDTLAMWFTRDRDRRQG
jgi:hypothetical protein